MNPLPVHQWKLAVITALASIKRATEFGQSPILSFPQISSPSQIVNLEASLTFTIATLPNPNSLKTFAAKVGRIAGVRRFDAALVQKCNQVAISPNVPKTPINHRTI